MQQAVKTVARTEQLPARTLFMPLFFAAAAKVAGLTPEKFYNNPTKISNGLRQLQGPLRCDILACYVDQTLLAEALGATLNWGDGLPQVVSPPPQLRPEAIVDQGRVPVMLEVVRRLRAMLRDRVALAVALPGPVTTAGYLIRPDQEPESSDYLAAAGGSTLQAARAACEAGADLILLIEARPPPEPMHEQWLAMLKTICNVTRFHEALPVLLILANGIALLSEVVAQGAVPCLPTTELTQGRLPSSPYGLALPGMANQSSEALLPLKNENCALITTAGDLPFEIEARALRASVANLRQIVT